ncbi:hypothetical protein AB0J63_46345 [Streptosporangium canum]|uniref:hypothetical protein n=1 Tax=Streptosporangium canum TaxID=324952 RepID=UPI00343A85D1
MTIVKRSAVILTLAAAAVGALAATVALSINGLEQASWIAAVVTLPLTIVSVVAALRQRTSSQDVSDSQERDSPNGDLDKGDRSGEHIKQINHTGANIAQTGNGTNTVINLWPPESPKG